MPQQRWRPQGSCMTHCQQHSWAARIPQSRPLFRRSRWDMSPGFRHPHSPLMPSTTSGPLKLLHAPTCHEKHASQQTCNQSSSLLTDQGSFEAIPKGCWQQSIWIYQSIAAMPLIYIHIGHPLEVGINVSHFNINTQTLIHRNLTSPDKRDGRIKRWATCTGRGRGRRRCDCSSGSPGR